MSENRANLGVLDYIVLVGILVISVLIGVYQGASFKLGDLLGFIKTKLKIRANKIDADSSLGKQQEDGKQANKLDDYLTAKSSMGIFPISFSLFATFFTAVSLIGTPSEIYQYGIQYLIASFGYMNTPIFGALVTGPFFAKLNVVSVYEYIELRYKDKRVKLCGNICFILRTLTFASLTTLGPSAAVSLTMNLDQLMTIAVIGFIGTIYTALGGIKAVVYTDFFQAIIMLLTVAFIVIKGTLDVGGLNRLLDINRTGGRLNLFDFDPDPFVRQSFWSLYIGGAVYFSLNYCFDQQMIQRFIASKSKRSAQIALLLNIPFILLFMGLSCFTGLVVYANYSKCDPLRAGFISNVNHYSSYFVLQNLNMLPGVVGLFLGAVFCSSLSTLSSCLHSLSLIIWNDCLVKFDCFEKFTNKQKLNANKLLVLACGTLSTILCYLISLSNLNLTQLNNTLNGTFNAPLIGLFLTSMFFSVTNKYGALCGVLIGLVCNLTISIGAFIVKPSYPTLNTSIESCFLNRTYAKYDNTFIRSNLSGFTKLVSLSYMWYTAFGALITVLSSVFISILTGGLRNRVDKAYLVFDFSKFFKLE